MEMPCGEEFGDDDPDNIMKSVSEENGDVTELGALPIGEPPVTSCMLLLRFLDDAINVVRALQYVTVGLMGKLDEEMRAKFPYQDLFSKLQSHAACCREWHEKDTSESQQAVIESARSLCLFFPKFSRKHGAISRMFPLRDKGGRKYFLAGNCPCDGSSACGKKLMEELQATKFDEDIEVVVCPTFVCSPGQVIGLVEVKLDVAAPSSEKKGEGEAVVVEMSSVNEGVKWVAAGHFPGGTSAVVACQCARAISLGLSVVVAVGGTLRERGESEAGDVIVEQVKALAGKVKDWSKVVMAYAPGAACSPEEAQAAHCAIRECVKEVASEEVSSSIRIVYVAPEPALSWSDYAKQTDIDGFFVAGAPWDAGDFADIVDTIKVKQKFDFAVEQMMSLGEEPEPPWPEFLGALLRGGSCEGWQCSDSRRRCLRSNASRRTVRTWIVNLRKQRLKN